MDKPEVDMIHTAPPPELTMPLGEAMFSQRAIRRFRHDRPISEALIKILLDAAAKAPSGGNIQPARFLVVRDRDKLRAFGALYHEAWWAKRYDDYGWTGRSDMPEDSPHRFAAGLADEMADKTAGVPLVVLAFALPNAGGGALSVVPGVQNLMLAARAMGIGSVLTTLHASVMQRVYQLFNVPPDIHFHTCIPLGYPRGNFGPTRRYPTGHTTCWDEWGTPPPWR